MAAAVAFAHPTVQPASPTAAAVAEVDKKDNSVKTDLTNAQLLERINDLLNMFAGAPTADDWTKLGPQAVPVLGGIARDKTTLVTRRKRAIAGLSFFPNVECRTLLKALVTNEQESYRIRGQAALSYALVAGKDAVNDLTPLLNASKFRLREATIKAFAQIKDTSVIEPLRERLGVEPKAFLKDQIEKVLNAQKLNDAATTKAAGAN